MLVTGTLTRTESMVLLLEVIEIQFFLNTRFSSNV